MITRRALLAHTVTIGTVTALRAVPGGRMTTTDDTIERINLTQAWSLVHGVHYTGTQPGTTSRWAIMSAIRASEVLHLAAVKALIDRDNAADARRRTRGLPPVMVPIRVMVAGDSIAVGSGSTGISTAGGDGWRGWLAGELDRADYAVAGLDVVAGGVGKMLDDLAGPIAANLALGPNVVILAIGTNDSAWGNPNTFGARHLAQVDAILNANPNLKVVCATIPISHDRAQLLFASPPIATVQANQATINTAIRATVAARPSRVVLADMTPIGPEWLFDGGWHPGDGGYALMARIYADAIRRALALGA